MIKLNAVIIIKNMKYDKDNIIILGKGFLGQAFEQKGYTVLGRDEFEYPMSGYGLDQLGFLKIETKAIVNTIAFTDTKSAEYNMDNCLRLNMQLPKDLSDFCKEVGYKFVHIGTGCVYQHPHVYDEYSEDSPISTYILSKALGDKNCGPNDLIIRPRLLFGHFNHPNNLITKLMKFNRFLTEQNSITSVDTIIESVEVLLNANKSGIYNVAQEGTISMHEISNFFVKSPNYGSYQDIKRNHQLISPNIKLDLSKLKEVYSPREVHEEIKRCLCKDRVIRPGID